MKKSTLILVILLKICVANICNAQTIFAGWGPIHAHTRQTEKLVNSRDAFFYDYTQQPIGFEYRYKAFSGMFSISKFSVSTLMRIRSTHYDGYAGSKITRYDLALSYNLLYKSKRFFIKPMIGAGLQVARHYYDIWGELVNIHGPDYFQTQYPTSEGWDNTQIVPLIGARLGVKFLRRMEFGLNMQGVFGFKSFEKLTLVYTYRNDPTIRTAKFESNGTGLYSCLFLGVNLKKFNDSQPDKKIMY